MRKRHFGAMLTLALLLNVTACGGGGAKKTEPPKDSGKTVSGTVESEKTTSGSEATSETTGSNFLASEKPLSLSFFYFLHEPYKEDYAVMKKAAELTNVSLTGYISQSASNNKEAFTLMTASGKMADIVWWDNAQIRELAEQGAFVALDDLMEHAPNLKKFLDENPIIKNHVTAEDGHIYTIPYIPDGQAQEGWFIRKDWLEKLQLKEPTNAQELYDVLKAFKEKDPNGNGQADEIPYFNRANNPQTCLADFAQLWGAKEGWYAEDGKVKYGPYEPAYKEAYMNLAKWFKEGLIDPEIYTRGKNARDVLLSEDKGGMTHDWFASTASYNDKENMPKDFNFDSILPPADINGKSYERTVRDSLYWCGWGISTTNPDPVATMKYFDFWFTEEGRRLNNFGIEGVTYDMVDGKPILKEEIVKGKEPVVELRKYGCQMNLGVQQDFDYEKQIMNERAKKGVESYSDAKVFGEQFPTLKYTSEETSKLTELMTAIDTLKLETAQKWVLGSESVESGYDTFKSSLETFGLEEAIKIQQAAYDRYMSTSK